MSRYYLAGGTALALHFGHRQSRDLDFFTRSPAKQLPPLSAIDDMLTQFTSVQWVLNTKEQVQWRLDGVSVTLLAYPFAHRFNYSEWRGVAVADPRDVAVQKAYTIGRRAQARDYLDLHAVLTRGVISLEDLMRLAQETYGDAFSPRLFLQQLTYTQDLPDRDDALSLLVTPQSFDVITQALAHEVQTWAAKRLGASTLPARGPQL
jgi:predicted nucleotidyltransferase component of viral defense system